MTLFGSFIGRYLCRDVRRSLTTVAGVALGIAVVVGIRLANASSVAGFEAALDAVSGRTSLEVMAAAGTFDETRVAELGWLNEYGRVSPIIDAAAAIRAPDGTEEPLRILGVDILRDRPLRDYRVVRREGAAEIDVTDFLSLLIDSRAVIFTEQLARRHAVDVGQDVELIVGDRLASFRVTGLLANEGPARVLDGSFALMDLAAAQLAFDRLGRLDRLDVRLRDDVDVADAEGAIAARLAAGFRVQRPERRTEQVERMLAAFQFNLTALSYIALIVGLFLVYNTVTVSVMTRRGEVGMLRAVGASRSMVLRLFLGEALVLGVVGCAMGAPLGWLLAHGAVRLTSTTINVLYVASAAIVPALSWPDLGLALALGVPLALGAAALPAMEASRVSPVEAFGGADLVATRVRLPRRFILLPAGLFALGAWLATLGPVGGLPLYGLGAALAVVFGAALLVPALLFALQRSSGGPLGAALGGAGRIAHANLSAAVPRLSVSVAALAVSLSMLVAIAVMIGSFRETVVYWVDQTLKADLFVSAGGRSTVGAQPTISAATEARIAAHPSVVAVDSFRSLNLPYGDGLIILGAGRFGVLLEHGDLLFKAPRDGRDALRRAAPDAVIVSESFSLKFDKRVGDLVELDLPTGRRAFPIAAVYYDYSSDRGIVVMDRATFDTSVGAQRPNGLTVYLREGADPEVVRDEMRASLPEGSRLFVRTNEALRREVLRVFDATFSITYALEGIAVFVALMGIAGTLVTLTLERRRDFTILMLVGAGAREVRRIVMIEALLVGAISQAVGLVVGTLLSLILIYVVNVQSFGWTIQFHLPLVFLAQTSLLVLIATAGGGLYPARLARRFEIGELSAVG